MKKSSTTNTNPTPNEPQQLIAGAYIRVSTARQEDEETSKVQVTEVRERAKADGNILPEENIFIDDGWTGTLLPRPSLDKMRMAAANGKFQILYTYDRGRIARKYSYQEIVIEELEDRDIRFVPLHDKEVETEEDRLLQGVQGLFSEWERTKIADRFRIAKQRRAEEGRIINGQALYGYKIIRKQGKTGEKKHETRKYAKHEEEAHIVRLMFEWVSEEGASFREVQRRLYKMGVPPRKGKSKRWTMGPIRRLLQTDTYVTGIAHYNKTEAIVAKSPRKNGKYRRVKKDSRKARPNEEWISFKVPKLIDRRMFNKVQLVFERNKKKRPRGKRKFNYLLTGLVYCNCGHKRTGDGGTNGNYYYRCAQRIYKFPAPTECVLPGMNAKALDTTIANSMRKFLAQPKLIRQSVKNYITQTDTHEDKNDEQEQLETIIMKVKEEQQRYVRAYGQGMIEFDQFQELTKETKRRLVSYEKQLADMKKPRGTIISPIHIDMICTEVSQLISSLDFTRQPEIIRNLINKVIIKNRRKVKVCGEFQLPNLTTEKLGYEFTSRHRRSAQCG